MVALISFSVLVPLNFRLFEKNLKRCAKNQEEKKNAHTKNKNIYKMTKEKVEEKLRRTQAASR